MSTGRILLPTEGATGGETATATCYCGAVQISFAVKDVVDTFICNCADCHKITASLFASNFVIKASDTKHVRGQDKLTKFAQSKTIATGHTMENDFCSVCGTLMYRISSGYPGMLIPRIGTVDDFDLMEGKMKPRIEQFTKDRTKWFQGGEGVKQVEGNYYTGA